MNKLDAHYREVKRLVGAREAINNARRGASIIWYVRPGSPNGDLIRLDALKRGLRYSAPWRDVDEIEVSEACEEAARKL